MVSYPTIKVLDHGHVALVDHMGSDQRIVDAARVSYQKGTKKVSTDRALIRYLLRNLHTTPFEKVRFEFHVKLPIFLARQWMRH
jgi:thymidylate synthase (FAD)